ncbi:gliding motility-associated C-terminal domain-containing protein [Pontibacter akesuensis]|uniref:Gliding motility-associated C-terminal domain-containing protein n=2 Tax=Pontibacter akesuensis TaxID=388950 RepID=A0A1I7FTD7_9BACT|nr:hypothetical protein GCM10007389_11100 [Pontibacter akesuensis]SFU39417.1 gliding motility-associated C-terminal domain-containing protein [Pontibacter akesuensis]
MCCVALSARATHIVGGEFEMQHTTGYNYKLTLNLYFDVVNGSAGARDNYVSVNIFSKATNRLISRQDMFLNKVTRVPYTNIDCTVGELRTDKLVYDKEIYLAPSIYNEPEGYYVVWERCCRNRTINNIENPEGAAQTFYMEFPPVTRNGEFYENSSPTLLPPLSDYACVGELFYVELDATDPDGDSLVYDMVTPLNGYIQSTQPAYYNTQVYPPIYTQQPNPAPYAPIRWLPGYGVSNQINGSPPISIDVKTGLLTMRPAQKGLFVFGVRVQEYRNKVKIGEIRRDFQVLVLDCPTNDSPKVLAKEQSKKGFYREGDILRINSTDASRCLSVLFTDPDRSEYIELRARPVNFSSSDYSFQGLTSGTINQGAASDTLRATLCFNECFDTEGKVYLMDLIVKDDGCSLPRQDTVRVSFIVEPLPDAPPTLSLSTNRRVFEVREGDQLNFDVLGIDPDNDIVSLSLLPKNFTVGAEGIQFTNKTAEGRVSSPFVWNVTCETLKQESYLLDFEVRSTVCGKEKVRTESIEVRTISNNNKPTIGTDQVTKVIELEVGKPFDASIFGRDIDLDRLSLSAAGQGFELAAYGMDFPVTNGVGEVASVFTWTPTCEAVGKGNLKVDFNLQEDACDAAANQTLTLEFVIKAPNNAPTLASDKNVNTFALKLNEAFEANFEGLDIDANNLIITAVGDGFNLADYGMVFTSINGTGKANGKFTWLANCPATEQEMLRVNFILQEDACDPNPQQITMDFKVEAPKVADYIPANIFTPNNDGLNDYFEVPELPSEFCSATFTSIRVFNRWGKEVYSSISSDFKWDGKGVNDGVYFYLIDYGTTSYKGSVTLVR